ncbi:hypothetical protein Tco_0017572 [Tanacetum coccineum]
MHNNIMSAGSRDPPPMLATGRYPQWRSRFLRYIDTRPNGDALRKCILEGPYTPSTVIIPAVPAKDNSLAVPERTTVETILNILMKCWEAIKRLQKGESLNIQDVKTNLFWEFGKFTSDDGETMESYYSWFYKLMNEIIRNNLTVATMQVNEVNEIRAERIAKNANPLALVAAAQLHQDLYYQASKSYTSYAPTTKTSLPTRSHATTRHKGKEIVKPITPPSESAFEEDSDPKPAHKDKEMQKNFVATHGRNQRTMTVAGTRETVGDQVQYDAVYNVFANEIQHSEQPESISNTCVVETGDSNGIPDSLDMCDNDIQNDQNAVECDDERVALANLIENLKLDVCMKNKDFKNNLRKQNQLLANDMMIPTFADLIVPSKKAQYEKPCLYEIPHDQSDPANRLVPDRKETLTLEIESRSKLNKDLVKPYDYTKLNIVESLEKRKLYELESDKQNSATCLILLLQAMCVNDVYVFFTLHSLFWDLDAYNELHELYFIIKSKNVNVLHKSFRNKQNLISKPSVLGKPTPFSDSLKRKHFSKTKSVPKTNVSEGLSKPVTTQNLPQTARQAVRNINVMKLGMYQIDIRTTQTRAPQLPQTYRNTNPRVSTSTRVTHRTNVSRPPPRSNEIKDKVVPNTSQVKFKMTEVEDHHRISSISNQTKFVIACNDNLKSKTSNVNAICATCGKCVFNSNHDACVYKFLNDVNARAKKPKEVPISTRKPKSQANKSVATPPKKIVASESTITKSKSYYRMLYEKTSKA